MNDPQTEMSKQIFLRVAEAVLSTTRSPLAAREIVERGIERGLFGDHVLGRTPEKSMQARLSLDIKHGREASRFMRVAKGRFVLRLSDTNAQQSSVQANGQMLGLSEYIAEPRKLRMPSEAVLCAPEHHYRNVLTFQGIDDDYDLLIPNLLKETTYIDRKHAEDYNGAKQFITYVLVQCGHRLLSFRRSYLSRAAEFLRGARLIGFGGHVSAADADIFSIKDRGIETCARRELSEELTIRSLGSNIHGSMSFFRTAPMECLGILNDDSSEIGRRHVAIVYRVWISDWEWAKHLEKGDSSHKSLSWIDLTSVKIDITEYEYWSQLCLRHYYPANIISDPVIKHRNLLATQRARAIVVSGRVGSGKSETSGFLGQRLGAEVINSGKILQSLMQAPPITEIGREEFQRRAEAFIRLPDGPVQLADAISKAIVQAPGRVVVDGIRQPETYEGLLKANGEVALLYVQTPPDVAFEMYRIRETSSALEYTYRDFLKVYDAPVEADLTMLGRSAHTYIYNFMGIDALRRSLDRLVHEIV